MEPFIFNDIINEWACLQWNPTYILNNISNTKARLGNFEMHINATNLWENTCKYYDISNSNCRQMFLNKPVKHGKNLPFAYIAYKYMNFLFKDKPQFLEAVDWTPFGFMNRNGEQSTFWMGTQGSYTPCHYDSYGYNLIAQIHGQKLWIMFPPRDTINLYPTRIPYEESSIFSNINPLFPNLIKYPNFKKCKPYACILSPGQVLYLPHHWWHMVLSISECPTISINTWIEMPEDKIERINEAQARIIISSLMLQLDPTGKFWINSPDDPLPTHVGNMELYKNAKADKQSSCPGEDISEEFNKILCLNIQKKDKYDLFRFETLDPYLEFIKIIFKGKK
ncbi:unnamed protein product [Gordionus sp. m RMFG-2023]